MDKEERNYCCLVLLLNRVGPVKLRKFFIDQWNSLGGFVPWSDCHQSGVDLLTKYKPLDYEKDKVRSGDTTTWDLSLFVKVLLKSTPPFVIDKDLVDGLNSLKETRNTLCHTANGKIKSAEFTQLYSDACSALLLVGASTEEFKKIEDDVKNLVWNELFSLVEKCADQERDIQQGLGSISSRLGELKKAHEKLSEGQSGLQEEVKVLKQVFQKGFDDQKQDKKEVLTEIENLHRLSKSLVSVSSEDLELYSVNLKEAITRRTDFMPKKIDQTTVKTDDIFTNLTLHHGEPKESLRQNRAQNVYQRARKTVTKIKQCCEIFVDDNGGKNPKSILVSGEPGIGKTLFSQKIMRDWSTDILSIPEIEFTYIITFRQLGLLGNKELTLQELLNQSPLLNEKTMVTEEIMAYIIQHPEKILVVLDGFDEYKDRNSVTSDFEEDFPNDLKIKMPVAALVSKLIQKKVLSDSLTMITSRPSEADALDQKIHFQRYVEITGFSKSQVIDYVERYFKCKPEKVRKMAVSKVKGSPHHISFGRAPFRCFLMCIFIEWELEINTKRNDSDNQISDECTENFKRNDSAPATLTLFYQKVIKCIERNYNRAIRSLDEKAALVAVGQTLDNFAQLAADLAQQNRFCFTSEDLNNFDSREKEFLVSSSLISCFPVSSNLPFQKPTCEYNFAHYTIQEFFVAWYFVKKGVMAAQESTEMVYTFMSGLLGLNDDTDKLMLKLLECLGKHARSENRLRLASLRCLYEYGRDKRLARQVLTENHDNRYWNIYGWIGLGYVADSDCGAIAMLVESTATSSTTSPPHRLDIDDSSLTCYGLDILLPSLSSSYCKITELSLIAALDDNGAMYLSQHLPKTKLTELNLYGNKTISDDGWNHIVNSLPSNLLCLNLSGNKISDAVVNHIANRLPNSLTKLYLSDNQISDECTENFKQFCKDKYPGLALVI